MQQIFKTKHMVPGLHYNSYITVQLCTGVAHETPILHTQQNPRISADIIDNDVIMLKFEHFRRKTLSFKRLYLSSLWMKHVKKWWG